MTDAEALAPAVVRETPLGRLWYRPDKAFETPKAAVYLDVESPAAYASPESSVLTRIFAKLLSDSLNELVYPADLAGVLEWCSWRVPDGARVPRRRDW